MIHGFRSRFRKPRILKYYHAVPVGYRPQMGYYPRPFLILGQRPALVEHLFQSFKVERTERASSVRRLFDLGEIRIREEAAPWSILESSAQF